MKQKRVLIIHAPGSNRDSDLAEAIRIAGGNPEIIPLSRLRDNGKSWNEYFMLVLPGGFSYGDALGAGRLWAIELQTAFEDALLEFVESGRPVIGICNGFQALVKARILPGNAQTATLSFNSSGHFECRWVTLKPDFSNPSPWLQELSSILCPVAHGEGRFLMQEGEMLPREQIALTYTFEDGSLANGNYPTNPNGSTDDIAGITNQQGNVLGLMPHPENHIHPYQNPFWSRSKHFEHNKKTNGMGVKLFENGLKF
ncbi:MAG: phosphoribosylformylglycinamidine synthase I [Anaerolineae bacterium]|nr:phosphoribosylformylglycinamidine synthase I [Anaerolineae bacterium]MDK1081039.1 phosphoribosylformylglycinamidine synthase I [Anaerolineae bacterium]